MRLVLVGHVLRDHVGHLVSLVQLLGEQVMVDGVVREDALGVALGKHCRRHVRGSHANVGARDFHLKGAAWLRRLPLLDLLGLLIAAAEERFLLGDRLG